MIYRTWKHLSKNNVWVIDCSWFHVLLGSRLSIEIWKVLICFFRIFVLSIFIQVSVGLSDITCVLQMYNPSRPSLCIHTSSRTWKRRPVKFCLPSENDLEDWIAQLGLGQLLSILRSLFVSTPNHKSRRRFSLFKGRGKAGRVMYSLRGSVVKPSAGSSFCRVWGFNPRAPGSNPVWARGGTAGHEFHSFASLL